jgi:hypothetical protein
LSGKDSTINHYLSEVLTPLKRNIEHLLTYLSSDLPWKNEEQKHSDKGLYSIISEKVSSLFLEKANATIKNRNDIYLEYKNLFEYFANNLQIICNVCFFVIASAKLYFITG